MNPGQLPPLRSGFSCTHDDATLDRSVETFKRVATGLMVLFVEEGWKTAEMVAFAEGKVFITAQIMSDALKYQAHTFFDSCDWDAESVMNRAAWVEEQQNREVDSAGDESESGDESEASRGECERERVSAESNSSDDGDHCDGDSGGMGFSMAECEKVKEKVHEFAQKWSSYDPGDDLVLKLIKDAIDRADANHRGNTGET